MKEFNIYEQPNGMCKTVMNGWSWPAFFFTGFWALFNKMWGLGISIFCGAFVILYIQSVFDYNLIMEIELVNNSIVEITVLELVAAIILSVVFGANGNKWKGTKLATGGIYRETITAYTEEDVKVTCKIKQPSDVCKQGDFSGSLSLWKSISLILMLCLSSALLLWFNVFVGAVLFVASLLFQIYGGDGVRKQLDGEKRSWVINFKTTWVVVIIFSIFSQFFYPVFSELFQSFGELPALTGFAMASYPLLLLLPVMMSYILVFWPINNWRLRGATMFGWFSIVLMLLGFGTIYLPILQMGYIAAP